VGADVGGGDVERRNALGLDVDYAGLIWQRAGNEQETGAGDDHAVALEDIRSKDHIGDAGFIFERQEDEAFGGAGTLAGDDTAGDADLALIGSMQQIDGREDVHCAARRGDKPVVRLGRDTGRREAALLR